MKIRLTVWSHPAKKDLRSIKKFYDKRNGTTDYSKKLIRLFRDNVKLIERYPMASIETDERNVRGLILTNYIIFFSIEPEHILILGVWDTRRDPEQVSKIIKRDP